MNEKDENTFNATALHEDQISVSKINKLRETQKDTLAKFDNAKFGWKHVKTCLIAGIGFFTVNQIDIVKILLIFLK